MTPCTLAGQCLTYLQYFSSFYSFGYGQRTRQQKVTVALHVINVSFCSNEGYVMHQLL